MQAKSWPQRSNPKRRHGESGIGSFWVSCRFHWSWWQGTPGVYHHNRGVYESETQEVRCAAATLPITAVYIHPGTELVSCFSSFNNVYNAEINWQQNFLAIFGLACKPHFPWKNRRAAWLPRSCPARSYPIPAPCPHAPIRFQMPLCLRSLTCFKEPGYLYWSSLAFYDIWGINYQAQAYEESGRI